MKGVVGWCCATCMRHSPHSRQKQSYLAQVIPLSLSNSRTMTEDFDRGLIHRVLNFVQEHSLFDVFREGVQMSQIRRT